MKLTVRTLCVTAVLVALSGCAHQAGGNKESIEPYAAVKSAHCETNAGGRVYRNQFLRARRIGQPACE
jgi:hypothetical protein